MSNPKKRKQLSLSGGKRNHDIAIEEVDELATLPAGVKVKQKRTGKKRRAEPAEYDDGGLNLEVSEKSSGGSVGSAPKTFMFLITVALVAFAIFKCISVPSNLDQLSSLALAKNNATAEYNDAIEGAKQSEDNFISQRTFELAYSDIDQVLELLGSVSGIQISSVKQLDPETGFSEVGDYKTGSDASAVKVDLVVADIPTALKSLEKAELAINKISISEPNMISLELILKGVDYS